MEKRLTIIIGASAAGLACAAQLQKKGITYEILEKQPHVAHAWRNHYDRLHLHTDKSSSELPFRTFPASVPKYPSRKEVVEYLESYCLELEIQPRFNTTVRSIFRSGDHWVVNTSEENYEAGNVIICTGKTNVPRKFWKRGIDTFPGQVIHSSEYKNGRPFRGKEVLVVGFGNSACEIAIDLHEHGAKPAMSVRSPVNVIPRDLLGIPVLRIGILQSALPPRWADIMNKPVIDLVIGDIEKYGLKKLPYGPVEQIVKYGRIPLLDIGTMDLIRKGEIDIYGDIENIESSSICFENDKVVQFDAIIAGIGYEAGLENFIDIDEDRKEDLQMKITDRDFPGKDNIYFCGFFVSPTGMLREIAIESGFIADRIAKDVSEVSV